VKLRVLIVKLAIPQNRTVFVILAPFKIRGVRTPPYFMNGVPASKGWERMSEKLWRLKGGGSNIGTYMGNKKDKKHFDKAEW